MEKVCRVLSYVIDLVFLAVLVSIIVEEHGLKGHMLMGLIAGGLIATYWSKLISWLTSRRQSNGGGDDDNRDDDDQPEDGPPGGLTAKVADQIREILMRHPVDVE